MLAREVNREVYHEVRELWKAHSIAEDRRDIAGLIATLTEDCVYEVFPGGTRWEGHAGAVRFYTELIFDEPRRGGSAALRIVAERGDSGAGAGDTAPGEDRPTGARTQAVGPGPQSAARTQQCSPARLARGPKGQRREAC